MLTERKHIALLGAVAALAAPAAASAAQPKNQKLPPRVRLRAQAPSAPAGADSAAADHAKDAAATGGEATSAIGDAIALDGPLLDPVDRYSRLIATTTHRTDHRQKVKARKVREAREEKRAEERQAREEEEQFAQLPGGVSMGTLEAIAACESGGDPEAVSPDGTYMGLFQFDQGTWESVGGTGSPIEASAAEQEYRAALLYSEAGSSPWPVCGQ